jgi:hypothetical protein
VNKLCDYGSLVTKIACETQYFVYTAQMSHFIILNLIWPHYEFILLSCSIRDYLCGLVVRVPVYRSRGPGFDSRRYQILWEVVDLERGLLSLVKIIEELPERKVAAPVQKTEINGRGDSLRWPRDTLYRLKFALTSPTSGGRFVGIVRWRTKASEFSLYTSVKMKILYIWSRVFQQMRTLRLEVRWVSQSGKEDTW